ncbi:MAG: pyridoxamine 5'-phosphate oxidase family protein [Candidatus Thorarchaeota archaeon]
MVDSVLTDEVVNEMKEFLTPKFMVTKNSDGEPNVVPVLSWTVYEGNTLVYGDFMTYKTRNNVNNGNSQMSIVVFTTDLDSWLIKADFESYHRNDEVYEFIAQTPLFRYNQYTNARGAGVAKATWASPKYGISKLSVLSAFLKAKIAGRKVPLQESEEGNMPYNVLKRMAQMAAVKIIAYVEDDGYPVAFPEFGMLPVSSNRLVVKRGEERRRAFSLKDGMRVAISLVTLEPAAFQLKGFFREIDSSTGYIELDRVYTCSLPRPGIRVDKPMLTPEL